MSVVHKYGVYFANESDQNVISMKSKKHRMELELRNKELLWPIEKIYGVRNAEQQQEIHGDKG